MTSRSYGQFCGFARALELVGERWTLLVVRDLVLGPKRFTELRRGLPRIPTNILSARLKELEDAGVLRRRVLPRPAAGMVYELTGYGQELEDIVLRLGLWGARSLGDPRPDDIVTTDSLILALRATFLPEAAGDLRAGYQLNLGDVVVHARIDQGSLEVGEGPLAGADLVIETGPAIRALLSGEVSPGEAVQTGCVRLTGDPDLLTRFVEAFHIPPAPVALPA
ncbi:MAG: helix-turn-helix transcriptional regulator [Candidatus Dormibacteraeota bacterium]|nr:helix-turn-helix transcriptional regulator [Candidatus Dormibacteraeota bacterium]